MNIKFAGFLIILTFPFTFPGEAPIPFKSEVSFENIQSFYKTDSGKELMCPIGKYDPINLNDMKEINNNIKKNNIWDLKCYNHNSGKVYFFAFYL